MIAIRWDEWMNEEPDECDDWIGVPLHQGDEGLRRREGLAIPFDFQSSAPLGMTPTKTIQTSRHYP